MKRAWANFPAGRRRLPVQALCGLIAAMTLAGCAMPRWSRMTGMGEAAEYHPTNVHRKSDVLPQEIKRVAVLPISGMTDDPSLEAGEDALGPVLQAELEKTKRFEIVAISPEEMKRLTGQAKWRPDEELPEGFFERLHTRTGCDAVLFCQLARYHAYPPLAVGWKLSLVQGAGPEILWSIDEMFDAGNPEVASGARAYYTQHIRIEQPLQDSETILRAPALFGQYSLSAVFGTLPQR
jgi:hypothetical protein